MTERYFDHAAAVPVTDETMRRLASLFAEYGANQEASGAQSQKAAAALRKAEEKILTLFAGDDAMKHRLLWTSSGTESVNAAFRILEKTFVSGGVIFYTDSEHASVYAQIRNLPENFRRVKIPLDRQGRADEEFFRTQLEHISSGSVILSLPFVQSETGAVQNIAVFRRILSGYKGRSCLFCDGIQGAGKLPFDWKKSGADLFAFSGQKLGCPSGGGLILKEPFSAAAKDVRQNDHRVSRLPVPFGILLAEQLEKLFREMPDRLEQVCGIRKRLLELLETELPGGFETTLDDAAPASPYILHLLLKDRQGAIITRALAGDGYSAAPGSACDGETKEPSRVLTGMGIRREKAYSGLRISFFDGMDEASLRDFSGAISSAFRSY